MLFKKAQTLNKSNVLFSFVEAVKDNKLLEFYKNLFNSDVNAVASFIQTVGNHLKNFEIEGINLQNEITKAILNNYEKLSFNDFLDEEVFKIISSSPIDKIKFNQLFDNNSPDQLRDLTRNTIMKLVPYVKYLNASNLIKYKLHYLVDVFNELDEENKIEYAKFIFSTTDYIMTEDYKIQIIKQNPNLYPLYVDNISDLNQITDNFLKFIPSDENKMYFFKHFIKLIKNTNTFKTNQLFNKIIVNYMDIEFTKFIQNELQDNKLLDLLYGFLTQTSFDLQELDFESLEKFIINNKLEDLIEPYLNIIKKYNAIPYYLNELNNILVNSKNLYSLKNNIKLMSNFSENNFIVLKKKYNSQIKDKDKDKDIDIDTNNKDVLDLVQYLKTKDIFYLDNNTIQSISQNIFINEYAKYKSKTYIDIYHESFKKNYNIITIIQQINDFVKIYSKEYEQIKSLQTYDTILQSCTNFNGYIKHILKSVILLEYMHNVGINADIINKAILNKNFDVNNISNLELLDIITEVEKNKTIEKLINEFGVTNMYIRLINKNIKKPIIDIKNAKASIEVYNKLYNKFMNNESLSFSKGSQEYEMLKKLHTNISLYKQMNSITAYIRKAKPKDENLFKLDIMLPNNINFRVLKFLDPYTLQVGVDTNCCQRIGGAGHNSVIDSFINPLAGVLICENNNNLISQSYFHFVPEDNGFILDNIEVNHKNMSKLGISQNQLSKIYSMYVEMLKNKYPDIKYVKCGIAWTKIDLSLFEEDTMKNDPRKFDTNKYTDFSPHKHYNLDKPKKEINNIQIKNKYGANYNTYKQIIKTSYIRMIRLQLL